MIVGFFLEGSPKGILKTNDATSGEKKNKKKMQLRAIKNIAKGEEITMCYLFKTESVLTSGEMKKVLQDIFKFDCTCDVCKGKISDKGDLRRLLVASTLLKIFVRRRVFIISSKMTGRRRCS